jgi:multiple sugar transport system substrate-binding protein
MGVPVAAQSQRLSVLSPFKPDPIPPGVNNFAGDLMGTWQLEHDTAVDYETLMFPEIGPATDAAFATGRYVHDLFYNWATVPEYAGNLLELGSRLPEGLISDLAPSQAASVSWQEAQYGVVYTLSLMLLSYNRELFDAVGASAPPTTWDELKQAAAAFGGDAPMGLIMPYGAAAGIGGVTSLWMALLQQAGGRMYDDAGKPDFVDAPGIDALQLMVDLMPYTTPDSLNLVDPNSIAFRMNNNGAAMTFTFPAFWGVMNGGAPSGAGKIVPAVMPRGPENNASVNGVDAWTIAAASPNPDLATQLIGFYLSPEVQKRQLLETGWLPARLSVLADPEVQQATALAGVMLEQAQSPFDSFVARNYMAVTNLIGMEIQRALAGAQTAAAALTAASAAIQPLLMF